LINTSLAAPEKVDCRFIMKLAVHDLNLQNLDKFCEIPGILEVSIGHALVADALEIGMADAVRTYLRVLTKVPSISEKALKE
jgi:pyridoxine 5-phosphate synthase